MDTRKLQRIFKAAYSYMRRERPDELAWGKKVSSDTYRKLSARRFMMDYVWVVYAAGFRVETLEGLWPRLRRAYAQFDLEQVAAMRSARDVLSVFGNKRKLACVLKGARMISREGFVPFKNRIAREGADGLICLPGIGEITKNHLARNIGLAAIGKGDIWIVRLAKAVGTSDWSAMLDYLARRNKLSPGTVDLVLWRFCADGGWRADGYRSFKEYVLSR
jgi:hypothetical protein